jgi:ferritin-like metal-binding protein YciE
MRKLRPGGDRMGRRYVRAGAAAGAAVGVVALVVQTKRASTLLQAPPRHDVEMDDPKDLFAHDLSDVLYVERSLATILSQLADEATHRPLQTALRRHLKETEQHAKNVEAAFEATGLRPEAETSRGLDGIRAEHDEFVSSRRPTSAMLDLYLTGAAARTEHYEIAAYTGLITMAGALGEKKAATLLRKNLRQEQAALKRVTDIATKLAAVPESAKAP